MDERLEGLRLFVLFWFAARGFRLGVDGDAVLVGGQEICGRLPDEGPAVSVEGTDIVAYFVDLDVSYE